MLFRMYVSKKDVTKLSVRFFGTFYTHSMNGSFPHTCISAIKYVMRLKPDSCGANLLTCANLQVGRFPKLRTS